MKLLIVDDQPGVVRGLQQGIDWAAEGVFSQVETAFNALEARAVFRQGAPDVMLCDIEMPVESGLALFEWVRREGHGTRCIFLTSHAEFQYAQEAVRLGATDYIVQPAPYAAVLRVVRRAVDEVRRAQEKDQMVDIGEAFSQEKMTIAAGVQRDFLLGAQDGQYWPTLDRLGCLPVRGVPCHLVLVQVVRWYSLDDRWDGPLMAVALTNIVNEIFVTNSCRAVVSFMEANTFALVLQDREGERQSTEELSRQLLYLNSVCEQYLRCSVACYVETPVFMRQLAKAWPGLLARRDGNVALRSGVFCQPEQEGGGPHHFYQSQVQHWGALLRDGYPQAMEEEAFRLLDELVERGVLDAAALGVLAGAGLWERPMAVYPRPRVLLADEPTAALDVSAQKQVLEELLLVRESFGTAVVLVSHNLGLVAAMADRVLVMHRGEIVEAGETRQVLRQPRADYTRRLLEAVPKLRRA